MRNGVVERGSYVCRLETLQTRFLTLRQPFFSFVKQKKGYATPPRMDGPACFVGLLEGTSMTVSMLESRQLQELMSRVTPSSGSLASKPLGLILPQPFVSLLTLTSSPRACNQVEHKMVATMDLL